MTILSWPHWSGIVALVIVGGFGTSMTILSWPHWSCVCVKNFLRVGCTSMTILSWPHWSMPIFTSFAEDLALPWLFCHGPIEASILLLQSTCCNDFHDYFVMAPLKQEIPWKDIVWSATSMTILSWPHWSMLLCFCVLHVLETSMTILSWPHWSMCRYSATTFSQSYFHDYFVMAPLKRPRSGVADIVRRKLPWLFCHGPIEAIYRTFQLISRPGTSMTILSWPHWSDSLNIMAILAALLPWLFCHGPIEARCRVKTSSSLP